VSQLLTEIDGIRSESDTLVRATTNRVDMLDPALLSSGSFGMLHCIGPSSIEARKKILEITTKGKPISSGLEVLRVAGIIDGGSVAEVAAVANTTISLLVQEYFFIHPKTTYALRHVLEAIPKMKHFGKTVLKIKASRDRNPAGKLAASCYG
jgi:SpoVK/Ycf46/Vps4 family AAA+-type ATPase